MRIRISISPPLPKQQCWFAISEKLERQTIHQLSKTIAEHLKFADNASNLALSMDGFLLLPQTKIKDLLRDGDLITVKEEQAAKKRKSLAVTPTDKEQSNELDTPPIKKSKKVSSKREDKNIAKKEEKQKSIKKEEKQKKSKEKEAKKKEKQDKKKAKDDKKKEEVKRKDEKKEKEEDKRKSKKELPVNHHTALAKVSKPKGIPFEGTKQTKKRNMRRKLLKQIIASQADTNVSPLISAPALPVLPVPEPLLPATSELPAKAPEPEDDLHELQVEKLTISPSSEPSKSLLKKNKNKKKNHLKGSKAENRSHVYYDAQEVDSGTVTMAKKNDPAIAKNPYGRAFITTVECERKYKNNRPPDNHLPVHRMPTLFYAQEPVEYAPAEQEDIQEKEPDNQDTQVLPKPTDYEQYPDADFQTNIPSIGSHLAIKTLELTANYTPEISDWKQVILKELDLPNTVTFEYVKGFGKAVIKGGRFDIKKHRQRKYYYDEEQEQEEEEEEEELINEDEQEQDIVTLVISDVFAVKNMS